jgi:hypothetical protein
MARTKRGPCEQAFWAELSADQRKSGLGVAALQVARLLDDPLISPRDAATVLAQLRPTVADIRKAIPSKPLEDSLAQRRARRDATRGTAG